MMSRFLLSLAFFVGSSLVASGAESKGPAIIPRPERMELGEGSFSLGPQTAIVVEPGTRRVGEYLAQLLKTPTGFAARSADVAGRNAV